MAEKDLVRARSGGRAWGIVGALVVLALLVAAGLWWQRSRAPATITVVSWGGTTQEALRKAVFTPFAQDSGITVAEQSYNGELELIHDMVERNTVRWNVVHVEDDMMFKAAAEGWLTKLPEELIPTDALRQFAGGDGVPIFAWGTVLAWNQDRLAAANLPLPASWSALWDPAYPGPIGLRKSPIGTVEIALLANGYERSRLYPLSREKVVEAFGFLDQIRSKISWWTGGAEHQQKLLSEYSLAAAWSGRVWPMMQNGERVGMTYNQGLVRYDWWVIPRGASRNRESLSFLRFATRPEVQARFCELTGYGPGNPAALPLLSERVREFVPVVGEDGNAIVLDGKWWAANIDWAQDLWIKWLGE